MKKCIAVLTVYFSIFVEGVHADCVDPVELEFFNTISGTLEIKLSKEPVSGKNLSGNKFAESDAKIISMELKPEIYMPEMEFFRTVTPEEMQKVAYNDKSVELVSESGISVKHDAPNGKYFTVKSLLDAVEETERQTRGKTEWFGGIDVHHIYFEGIHCEEGQRLIFWGS